MQIKVAKKSAVIWYWSGLLRNGSLFFPITSVRKEEIKKYLQQFQDSMPPISKIRDYKAVIKVKREILQTGWGSLSSSYLKTSQKLQRNLSALWKKNRHAIATIVKQLGLPSNFQAVTVYVIPKIGESAEALGNILVLGDSFSPTIALGVLIEEYLHTVIKRPFKHKYLPNYLSEGLKEEIIVGYYLCLVLSKLKEVSSKDRDSLVFGWRNGRRARYVRKLIECGMDKNF